MGSFFGKFSNDTQENSKDAQKREEVLKEVQEENIKLKEENAKLYRERNDLAREKDNLTKANTELTDENTKLQKQIKSSEQSQQALENENTALTDKNKALTTEKDNLAKEKTELTEKNKALTTEKDELEQKHAPYKKLERLYEVFLEVKGCLNFGFVEKTHSAMDLIAYVLSDSKYYLESLYTKASQELSDKRSDKGEKLAELFDSLFEYVKDNKFERLKEPSAYDSTCKSLYPEQNTSQKMQRVVLIGYTYDKKTPPYYTIVDMGS
ncbi:hypothetical protein [Helicobacter pylori]|uniref:hypothetical protein n=1 Tax=Helicobacter pylori TaxID=210 RepID=UPI000C30FEFA